MDCYVVRYTHRFGEHRASKWAQSADEALSLVKKSHAGMTAAVGLITYAKPELADPQPFSGRTPDAPSASSALKIAA